MPTLDWIGKSKVVSHHLDVPAHALDRAYSFGEDSGNMIVHGDNLLALKALLPQFAGKVDCIYIDPPYNTGNEGWVYNDNVADPRIRKWLGQVVGTEGEDLSRHDKWLCMMYPRLKLLQRLLAEDGVVFISIDDNEQANLKLVCDEIFGDANHVATLTWKSRAKPSNVGSAKFAPQNDSEYVLCYKGRGVPHFLPVASGKKRSYPHEDKDGRYRLQTILKSNRGESHRATMSFGLNGWFPPAGKRWQAGEEVINSLFARNRITFQTGEPMLKYYEHEETAETAPFYCHIPKEESGSAESGKSLLNDILGNTHGFDTVKPIELIQYVLAHSLPSNGIVLDSFAGSGTTAHAVLNLNREDGGTRRFILVEMEDYAEGITAERVRRVIRGYGSGSKAVAGTGGGFSFHELGPRYFLEDGSPNPELPEERLREYVYFMETREALPERSAEEPALLGVHLGTAYYLFPQDPDGGGESVLSRALLHRIRTRAEAYVVYAGRSALDEAQLAAWHITFKKIPRDIARL